MHRSTKSIAARQKPRHSQAQQGILIRMLDGQSLTVRAGICHQEGYVGRVTFPSVENLKGMGLILLTKIEGDGFVAVKTYELTDAGRAAAQQGSNYYRK